MNIVKLKKSGGAVTAHIRILNAHPGTVSLALWRDVDNNGRPDTLDKELASWGPSAPVGVGSPSDVVGKFLQWLWMPSQPPGSTADWEVELTLRQGSDQVFASKPTGKYPADKFGIFQLVVKLDEE